MPKAVNNNVLNGVSGKLGNNIVIRQTKLGTIVANKPKDKNHPVRIRSMHSLRIRPNQIQFNRDRQTLVHLLAESLKVIGVQIVDQVHLDGHPTQDRLRQITRRPAIYSGKSHKPSEMRLGISGSLANNRHSQPPPYCSGNFTKGYA